jgi:hemolysin activation/secretion protein
VHKYFRHSAPIKEIKSPRRLSGVLARDITATAFLIGVSGTVLAQDAGALLREQQRQQELQKSERLSKPEDSRAKQATSVPPATGETVLVKELRFTGKADLLAPAERARLVAEIQNKRVGIAGLQALADEVTGALQKQGRLLARAILPPQDITAGVVTFNITEGALESIDIERGNGVRVRETLLRGIIQRHVQTDDVAKQSLEEALLRVNELPGVAARAKLVPGTAPNTSRMIVGVEQAPILSASLGADNYGQTGTGRNQGNALVALTDLTGLGDEMRFAGAFTEGQKFGQADLSAPLGASGVTGHASYSHLTYHNIDEPGRLAGLEGSANQVGLGLDYSLIRSRKMNLRLSTKLNQKSLIDDTSAGRLQDKRVRSVNVALAGELRDALGGGALSSATLDWTRGDLDLSRVTGALDADAAGLKTQGIYQRVSMNVARLQSLPGDFSLFTRVYGQWANKNLDSSEDFALGGPYGVRGWQVGEGRGDTGLLGTLELRYDAPVQAAWGRVQLSAFVDGGRVRTNKNPNGVPLSTACGCNSYNLSGAGLGVRWSRENVSLSAFYAQGIGGNPGRSVNGVDANGESTRRQFWLQSAIWF